MIQLSRSTLLADAHSIHTANRNKKIDFNQPIVNVGKLGIGHRTTVGNAHEYIDYPDTKNSNVDAKTVVAVDTDTGVSESHVLSKKITSSIGKAAGIAIIGSMIMGPPAVGYILFDWIGFAVGSMVAAPFVMIFVWALVS